MARATGRRNLTAHGPLHERPPAGGPRLQREAPIANLDLLLRRERQRDVAAGSADEQRPIPLAIEGDDAVERLAPAVGEDGGDAVRAVDDGERRHEMRPAGNERRTGVERPVVRRGALQCDEHARKTLVEIALRQDRARGRRRLRRGRRGFVDDLERVSSRRLSIHRRLDRPRAQLHIGHQRELPIRAEPAVAGFVIERVRRRCGAARAAPLSGQMVAARWAFPLNVDDHFPIGGAVESRPFFGNGENAVRLDTARSG
ncbi:MAG: hypothetical protein DMF86_25410 [Acidobacteria bacterium]|nr:MAG: hypothetical protein DMF86_25410 [Acidobacteriota bacterium]